MREIKWILCIFLVVLMLVGCARGTGDASSNFSLPGPDNSTSTPERDDEMDSPPEETPPIIEILPVETPSYEDLPITDALKEVLSGETGILHVTNSKYQEELYIDDLTAAVTSEKSFRVVAKKFAVLDLDRDGTSEVVLFLDGSEMPGDFGYEILHDRDGQVYGYHEVTRGLIHLKADGTYMGSSGGFDWGFYRIMEFTDEGFTVESTGIYCTSKEDQPQYFVEGESVTEQVFNEAVEECNRKENVIWYDLFPTGTEV